MKSDNREPVPEFARIRLFVQSAITPGVHITLSKGQSHYLRAVMRRSAGDSLRLFNGHHGEWAARILSLDREAVVEAVSPTRPQDASPNVTLAFAPIKKSPMEYLVEKATELGVGRLQPVMTARTQVHHVNEERHKAQAIEAAEQSWRLSVPDVATPMSLTSFLDAWTGAPLLYCDERLAGAGQVSAFEALRAASNRGGGWAILIGPEGGFAPEEQLQLEALPNSLAISLGPRIVRAETAAVMALTLWQAALGDLKPG